MVISTADITTKDGCQKLIDEASDLGPVAGIFNLAVVLQDAILENQTEEKFKISFGPKALATKYLDEITRKDCPELKYVILYFFVNYTGCLKSRCHKFGCTYLTRNYVQMIIGRWTRKCLVFNIGTGYKNML